MRTKLYIGSELADFNEPFNVMFSIGDIRNLSAGNNNKSYTLKLPLTKTNKRLIKFINQVDVKTETSDLWRLYLGESLIIQGYAKISSTDDFFAFLIISSDGWIDDLKEKKMTELDLSASDHTLNHANVQNSWSAAYPVYRYPFIDFGALASGETGTTAKWSPLDFIPMISVASLITKILEPYTISSTWLASNSIKDLYILATEKANSQFIKGKNLDLSIGLASDNDDTATITPANTAVATFAGDIIFSGTTEDESTSWASNMFTVPETGTYRFVASILMRNTAYGNADLTITDESYDVAIIITRGASTIIIQQLTSAAYTGTELVENITLALDSNYYHFIAGDVVTIPATILCEATNNSGGDIDISVGVKVGSTLELVWSNVNKYSGLNKNISLEELLPNMSQTDFLTAIKDIYNLRFWMDKMKRIIYIEPWDHLLSSTVVDLTPYIDNNNPDTEFIASSYNKEIKFTWKRDTSDLAFTEYLQLNSDIPGTKDITLLSEVAVPGEMVKEHPFSGVINAWGYINTGYINQVPQIIGEKPEYPYITFDRFSGFNIRIVEWKGLSAGFTWHYEGDTLTDYPKIDGLDWATIYSTYLQKMYHYIDRGKLMTFKLKILPIFLSQFFTVINTAANEGFRPTYKITVKGVDNYFFIQTITTDGELAEIENILKQ